MTILDEIWKNLSLLFQELIFHLFQNSQETTCDVIDEGKQLRVKVNLPGITKKEIHLNVSDSAMEVYAEHKEESEEKKKNYLRKERNQVSYSRILPLPEKVIPDKVKIKTY